MMLPAFFANFASEIKEYTMAKKATIKKVTAADSKESRLEALKQALNNIEKDYGRGAIMKLGEEKIEPVEVIPTGSIGLNFALGVGGFPRGRIIEIYGPESSGKTTLALHAIAEAQKKGGIAAMIDAEHAFDRFYAEKLGVDVNNLLISQPDNGEQALEIAEELIRSSAIDILVVDSVAALTPKSEIEGEMGERQVGLQARLMSQALRKLTGTISRTNTVCVFINQLRANIGGGMFAPTETTTGGNALKFYASVRVDVRPSTAIKDGDKILGKLTKVRVVKNKVAPPFKRAEFDIMFGEGISKAGEIIDLGVEYDIIKKSGSWFSYNGSKIAQGRDAAKLVILDNPELAEELEAKIMAALAEASTTSSKKKPAIKGKGAAKDSEPDETPAADEAADDLETLDFDAELPDDDFPPEQALGLPHPGPQPASGRGRHGSAPILYGAVRGGLSGG